MSGALDGTEKIWVQKLDHPMLVQPILSQKNQKSKFFNEQFFCNWIICIFPYIKLEAKWRKNGSLCAVNCLILIKTALNSLLNKHWYKTKTFRIQSCSVQWRYMHETLILRQKLSLKLFYYRITKNWYKNQILDTYLHWTEQFLIIKVCGTCQCFFRVY